MKSQRINRSAIWGGAIALTLLSGAALPLAAQTQTPSTMIVAQDSAALIQQLKLTDKQKQQIAGIRHDRTIAINKVLTADQKTKFESARKAGKSTSATMDAIGLKPEQKTKIKDIVKKSAESIIAILSPDQKKTLATYLKQKKGAAVE